jgi:hypothetical protein
MAEKARSRNFPAFGLGEAITKAKQLYERDGKAAVNADIAVQAWGYRGLNGASLRALGGVRQYGLLDTPGTKVVKVSSEALTIILEPEDSAERAAAIRAAANAPAMFRELREQYPDSLPSDPAIVSWLVRNHNFGENGAKALIASYRDTLAIVERLPKADTGPDEGNAGDDPIQGHRRAHSGKTEVVDWTGGFTKRPAPNPQGAAMQFQWPLSGDAVATLTVTKALELDDIETLTAYFEIAKKALRKAAKDQPGSSESPKPPEA